jgi:hypothetical protein
VKFSVASLGFTALLFASLAMKAFLTAPAPEPDSLRFVGEAAAMLGAEHFATGFDRRPFGILVDGRRGGCRLRVGDYSPYGTFADRFAERARPVGPLHFAYRGVLYVRAPKLVPLIDFYIRRELRRVGLPAARHPIAAVAASPGCDVARLDWHRLAAFPD